MIEVVEYSETWPNAFAQLEMVYMNTIGIAQLEIEHVGSTSVPGLAAKAIIDIDIVWNSEYEKQQIHKGLLLLGYVNKGEMGIEGREVYKIESCSNKTITDIPHHLYVCHKESYALKNHLTLRNHLRKHTEKAKAYATLKKEIALKYPNDMDAYVQYKTPFIIDILKECGFDNAILHKITLQNTCND